jgi:hypothetical protein
MTALTLHRLPAHNDQPVIVTTTAELHDVVDLVHRRSLDDALIAEATKDGEPSSRRLYLGMNGVRGLVLYQPADDTLVDVQQTNVGSDRIDLLLGLEAHAMVAAASQQGVPEPALPVRPVRSAVGDRDTKQRIFAVWLTCPDAPECHYDELF